VLVQVSVVQAWALVLVLTLAVVDRHHSTDPIGIRW
jgi:hypothetical protein